MSGNASSVDEPTVENSVLVVAVPKQARTAISGIVLNVAGKTMADFAQVVARHDKCLFERQGNNDY